MNMPQQTLSLVLGLTLLSSILATAQTPSKSITFTNPPQADWHLVTTDDSGNQWYLDTSAIETDHRYDHKYHAGYIKVTSPGGESTEMALGIDCQTGAVRQFSSSGVQQYFTHQSASAQAMGNAMCSHR